MHSQPILMKHIIKSEILALTGVAPQFAYRDGKKTDEIIGTRYFVVEMSNFDKFVVKVPGVVPKISQETLDRAKGKTYVRFIECYGSPYSNGHSVEWSFNAADIEVVDRSTQSKEVQ